MNKAKIRQQGFNDHGGGYEIYDNPFQKGSLHYDLWEEGWNMRDVQSSMFDKLGWCDLTEADESESCSETVCPHCGMELRIILE